MRKTVFITGSSSGIGKALAKEFLRNNWNVIATMRQPEKESELKTRNNILVTRLDLHDRDSIFKAMEEGVAAFGKIDVVINNAGVGLFGVFETTPEEKMRMLFETNLFGVMAVTKAILPLFRKQKSGMIVNVSSSTGLFTLPLMALYCASKYALEGFTESLSYELAAQNIAVKLIEPGMVESRFDETTRENYTADPEIHAYDDYINKIIQILMNDGAGEKKVTAKNAAEQIYAAITDGTATLRYIIGEEVKQMIAARRKIKDKDYMEMMRERFNT